MNCPRCGAFHQPNAPMCTACGTPLTVSLSGQAAYPPPTPYPAPPYAAPSPYSAPPPYAAPSAYAAPSPYAAPPSYAAPPAGYPQAAPPPYGAPPAASSPYPPGAGYGSPPGAAGAYDAAAYPFAQPKTSAMAVVGFIFAFLCNFVGLVLSIIALVRINGSQGRLRGKSLAIAGIILSAIFLVVSLAYRFGR